MAHPPGFPVFTQVHGAVMRLVPLGDVAFRGNLASGLLAALTLALVFAACRAWGAGRVPSVGAAALLALSPLFGLHAATVEVYSGAAAATAGLAWALAGVAEDRRWALAVAFGVGLAAGHHAELRLFAGVAIVALLWVERSRHAVGAGVGFAVFGALSVLYLPLRAAADPWRNWGDPSSPGALWDHLMGARIRMAYADEFGRLSWAALGDFGGQLAAHAPALLLVGVVGLALRRRWWLVALLVVDVGYATALNPMGLRDLQNGVPGLVVLAVGAGLGFEALGRRAVWGVAVAVAGTVWWVEPPGLSDDRGLPRVVDAAVDAADPEALALVASDSFAAGFAFVQVVEGARPDLAVVVRQHAWDASSVGPIRRRVPEALVGWRPGATVPDLARLREAWPVVWEWAGDAVVAGAPRNLGPRFPWFAPGARADAAFAQRLDAEPLTSADTRRGIGRLANDLGLQRLEAGNPAAALDAMSLAARVDPHNPARWNNLGVAFSGLSEASARAGRSAVAQELLGHAAMRTRHALDLDPGNRDYRANLARYLVNLGRTAAARAELEALLDADPADADALGLRGVLRGNDGDLQGACADFEAALRSEPNQAEAKVGRPRACGPRP